MSHGGGARSTTLVRRPQHGGVLLGLAGGMLVVAAGFMGGYYVLGTRSEANAATVPAHKSEPIKPTTPAAPAGSLEAQLAREVDVMIAGRAQRMTWPSSASRSMRSSRAIAVDGSRGTRRQGRAPRTARSREGGRRAAPAQGEARQGADQRVPRSRGAEDPRRPARSGRRRVRLAAADRRRRAPGCAEGRVDHGRHPRDGDQGDDRIDDISEVLGHYETKFPVVDRDRNFNSSSRPPRSTAS